MIIREGASLLLLRPNITAPDLAISNPKELLICQGIARDHLFPSILLQILLIGTVGFPDAAVVGNIFSDGHLAVDLQPVESLNLHRAVLVNHTLGLLVVFLACTLCPPVIQISNLNEEIL